MNETFDNVLFHLTGKKRLEQVDITELKQMTDAHPYFSPAHVLLSSKMKAEGHRDFAATAQRAALHFNTTLVLDSLLQQGEPKVNMPAGEMDTTPPSTHEAVLPQPHHEEPLQIKTTEVAVIVAAPEEEQYAADTTGEAVQQAEAEEKQKEVIASVLEEQLAAFKKPVAPDAKLPIATEPYHTVDYFASQGIKIDLSQPQDKLGTQVRKFTDWLKQMKNVKPAGDDLGTDPEVENMIQGIAKTSNETREIVTETMAEVLVKQGKTDKAIQLYIKLSFLNPGKSAYFAAKIEQLKGI